MLTVLQLFMPLAQGVVWTLALAGWRYWNTTAQFSGQTVGARIRRWWWKTNNWVIPNTLNDKKLAADVKEVRQYATSQERTDAEGFPKLLLTNLKYYQAEFSNAGAD